MVVDFWSIFNNNKILKISKISKISKIVFFWELGDETLSGKRFRPGDFKKHGFEKWFWIFWGFLIYQPTYQPFLVYNKKINFKTVYKPEAGRRLDGRGPSLAP